MGSFSIKQKLLLITMVSTTVALLLSAFAFLTFEFTTYRAMMVRDLSALAQITGSQSTAALIYGDKETAREVLHALAAKPGMTPVASDQMPTLQGGGRAFKPRF